MNKGYIYVFFVLFLVVSFLYTYRQGFNAGIASEKSRLSDIASETSQRLVVANKKILDLQRVIAHNNDECFNRVWPDDIISAVNP